ncbi:poly-gamma-glutamate hydrolase family protein [Streptomyces sp. J2-1]|uniref:poly-gamma-glutamate hydrolase family protein n=1 Tax=Streptomyces corallincola TaxID=2851888 RepID=UPI001C386EA3|nr:poly-gamma-glutamate hydrolase family protein [Streptomyces corallincola]MBV2356905.1 poly-gamma-glutamate hydrolase family protein [Streptomyces corallincola]
MSSRIEASALWERVWMGGVEFLVSFVPGSDVGVLALHGSREGGTGELVGEVAARTGASALVFTQPEGRPVHISSHRIGGAGGALLGRFLGHVRLTVSLHGHGRDDRSLFLGGGNRWAAGVLGASLGVLAPEFVAVTDLDGIPAGLRGLHSRNPVNLAVQGGVQVELPVAARTDGAADVPPARVVRALTDGVRQLAR